LKRGFSILFFVLLCLSQTGFFVAFLFQQHQLKATAKANALATIPLDALIRIEQQKGLQWEEDQKEFYLDGNLYDVVQIRQESDQTVYYCINDEKEKQLLNQWSNLEHFESNIPHSKHSHQTVKLIFDEFDRPVTIDISYKNSITNITSSFVVLFFPSTNVQSAFRPPQV
jgi:hypothetical protein